MEKLSSGFVSLLEMPRPQMTFFSVCTAVVSEIRGPIETFLRIWFALMSSSESIGLPANFTDDPFSMTKSLVMSELSAAKWHFPSLIT